MVKISQSNIYNTCAKIACSDQTISSSSCLISAFPVVEYLINCNTTSITLTKATYKKNKSDFLLSISLTFSLLHTYVSGLGK